MSRFISLLLSLTLAVNAVAGSQISFWADKPLNLAKPINFQQHTLDDALAVGQTLIDSKPDVVLLFKDGQNGVNVRDRTAYYSSLIERVLGQQVGAYLPYFQRAAGSPLASESFQTFLKDKMNAHIFTVSTVDDVAQLDLSSPAVVVVNLSEETAESLISALNKKVENKKTASILCGPETAPSFPRFRARRDVLNEVPEEGTEDYFMVTGKDVFVVYSFFSPGIFMGIMTLILLIIITLAGVTCLATLQAPSQFESKTE